MARVSILMPAFNAEKYIAASIESVLAQTYADWELIVVDDGSQDGTGKEVRAFALADKRIRLLRQENGGQGSARNLAINNSRGEFIALLDADDLWLPQKLELQIAEIERGVDVVFSDGFIFFGDDAVNESNPITTLCGRFDGADFFARLLQTNRIPALSALARRQALESVALFEERRAYQNCEDYDLWLRLAHNGAGFYGMPDKLVRYRRHEGNVSRRDVIMLRAELAIWEKWRDHPAFGSAQGRERRQTLIGFLILALMKEGRTREARRCLRDLSACGRFASATLVQRILLRLLPAYFVTIVGALKKLKLRVANAREVLRSNARGK